MFLFILIICLSVFPCTYLSSINHLPIHLSSMHTCLHSRDFNDWAFSPIPSGWFLSPSLLHSFVWFPILIGMWAPNPCLRVSFPVSHSTAHSWKLRVISFAITGNFFFQYLSFLCFFAGWIWGHLNETPILLKVKQILLHGSPCPSSVTQKQLQLSTSLLTTDLDPGMRTLPSVNVWFCDSI